MTHLAGDGAGAAPGWGRAAYDWYWQDPWSAERHVDDLLEIYAQLEPGAAPIPNLVAIQSGK